jgi:hypothetical protein
VRHGLSINVHSTITFELRRDFRKAFISLVWEINLAFFSIVAKILH